MKAYGSISNRKIHLYRITLSHSWPSNPNFKWDLFRDQVRYILKDSLTIIKIINIIMWYLVFWDAPKSNLSSRKTFFPKKKLVKMDFSYLLSWLFNRKISLSDSISDKNGKDTKLHYFHKKFYKLFGKKIIFYIALLCT